MPSSAVGERFIQNVSGLVLRLSAGEPARRSLTAQRLARLFNFPQLRHLLPDRLGVIWIQRRAAGGSFPVVSWGPIGIPACTGCW